MKMLLLLITTTDIRKTPKLIDAFNKQLFWDEDIKLTGIPDANVCVNKCEKEYPNCLVANYFEPLRNCLLFEKVHVTEENASKRLSGVYYRMQRSFCDEDEEYIANPNLNICYKYNLKKASWYEADLACKADGAHMANVPSEEVKEFLEETVNSVHFFDTQIHVGISEQKNSGIYVDWKNQPVKSSLWDKEFSGNYDRNCVTLDCWHDCTWEAKDCRSLKEFICVK